MGVTQDTFNQYRDKAYEGQVSTTEVFESESGVVETADIEFGRAVIAGAGERSCAPVSGATVAADIIGFTIRSMAVENDSNDEAKYKVGEVASILRNGRMFVKCIGGATKRATVHVVINTAGGEQLGQLRGAQETTNTIELTKVKWAEAVADGEIGEIIVDGVLV